MGSRNLKLDVFGFVAALVFLLGISAEIFAQATFYQGKNVTVVVVSAPGGLYGSRRSTNPAWTWNPSSGEEIQALCKELMDQPREVIERVKKLDEN